VERVKPPSEKGGRVQVRFQTGETIYVEEDFDEILATLRGAGAVSNA
jgi:hypothetical protein